VIGRIKRKLELFGSGGKGKITTYFYKRGVEPNQIPKKINVRGAWGGKASVSGLARMASRYSTEKKKLEKGRITRAILVSNKKKKDARRGRNKLLQEERILRGGWWRDSGMRKRRRVRRKKRTNTQTVELMGNREF